MQYVLAIVVAYLIGSVNFGIVIASSRGIDIRSEGSGNPGASNILRVLGKKWAAIVLGSDAIKGAFAAFVGVLIVDPDFGYVALLAAAIGHSFPIWYGFRGGKSVATVIGGIAFLAPWVGLLLAVVWIVIVLLWKTASIASIVAMVLLVPALAIAGRDPTELAWAAAIAAFVIVRHLDNIQRLVQSNERKLE